MKKQYKIIIILIIIIIIISSVFVLINNSKAKGTGVSYNATALSEKLTINMDNWNYDEDNDIYYQIGLVYCLNPEDENYESCGIYVPGKYFDGVKNSNGTYSCTINENNKIKNYTAVSAPIVIPVNTPGYSSCKAPTKFSGKSVSEYTDAGFIYLDAGCRGRDNGEAPDGVCDLKSAVTYYRFNGDVLPGDNEKIFTFGHSGGGAQSAIMGASGNSKLYNPYLESIGSAMVDKEGNSLSNAIYGSMCWCPITNLDTADAAYEWNIGQYTRENNTFEGELSKDLSSEYVNHVNNLKLKDPNGNTLTLDNTSSGSYYDYLLNVTEESLNNFLNDTTFPYTQSNRDLNKISDENIEIKKMQDDDSMTYKTAKDYIDSLNSDEKWIEYNLSSNTAKITSIEAFVKHCKNPTKSTPAFDDFNRSQSENELFGISSNSSLHFDSIVSDLLTNNSDKYSKYKDYSSDYQKDFSDDLDEVDSQNNTIKTRENMYNPMYYLNDYYNASTSSDVAKYWRINTGIEQGDTSQCVDVNLYLSVLNKVGSDNVEFSTVWGQGHTKAERTGNSTSNFINWVNSCLN